MIQLKIILKRLRNPSVILSIASQVISMLLIFNVDLDRNAVITTVTTICSILVLLGIMSNPDTQNKGYGDDFYECAGCHETTAHVRVGDSMVCTHCGCVNNNCGTNATQQ